MVSISADSFASLEVIVGRAIRAVKTIDILVKLQVIILGLVLEA